jgi:hypothetical protein
MTNNKVITLFATPDKKGMISLSYDHKHFLWLPPKTGSMRAADIFKRFGFVTEAEEEGIIVTPPHQKGSFYHHHDMVLFNGAENYKLVCTARNPYTRMVSYFKSSTTIPNENNQERFLSFLTRFFYPSKNDKVFYNKKINFNENWEKRIPDYYIRLEFMYEDYLKIPFVKDMEVYKTGELEVICGIKINENTNNSVPWREYYTEESADMVYYNHAKYFELLGYDRNSYKK